MSKADATPFTGTLNGQPFESLSDADARIGARLETFAAGSYIWIPLAHIASIRMEPPKRLRDLLWIPAMVRTGPAFKGQELGEVLVPALSPLTHRHQDEAVRLGTRDRVGPRRGRERDSVRAENAARGWRGGAAAGRPGIDRRGEGRPRRRRTVNRTRMPLRDDLLNPIRR